ncbi:MAG: hypothetical protein LUG18_00580 [Candidatus Azobacteroides sp.]|nr:hypothetical protein [Candidatus Azobacteroides sp.]
MKLSLLTYIIGIFFILPLFVFPQDGPWFGFAVPDEEEGAFSDFKIGFKDSLGNVMIPPTFSIFTSSGRFDDIIAVTRKTGNKLDKYYLLKDGRVIGRDSVYLSDMATDCESEGFIRFSDPETGRHGMFNRHGEVVIPAEYALMPVRNSLVVALTEPEKEYWDNHHEDGCNHWSWKGTRTVLMDTTGKILIEDFDIEEEVCLYSLKITEEPSDKEWIISYPGTNGKYYSFVSPEKYFRHVFLPAFLADLSQQTLIENTHAHAFYFTAPYPEGEWQTLSAHEFINRHYPAMKPRLEKLTEDSSAYSVSLQRVNFFPEEWIHKHPDYFDNCGDLQARYPVIQLRCKYGQEYNSYTFINTKEGFKLLSINI